MPSFRRRSRYWCFIARTFWFERRHQLWQLKAVGVPAGVDGLAIRKEQLGGNNIEIGAGPGPLKGKIWRIGLMGETSRKENVDVVLGTLKGILKK